MVYNMKRMHTGKIYVECNMLSKYLTLNLWTIGVFIAYILQVVILGHSYCSSKICEVLQILITTCYY